MDGKMIFTCEDDDFMIKGQDKEEIMRYARMHIKEMHSMDVSDEDLKAKIKMDQM